MTGGIHIQVHRDSKITTEKLLEAEFSLQSNLMLYIEDKYLLMIMVRSELQAPWAVKQ
jgi:hypothetical protein